MGNFERLEQLLLNKDFGELTATEKSFVLEAVSDQEEYDSMRLALLGSKEVFANEDRQPTVFTKKRLDDHFNKVHGSQGNNRLIITTIAATVLIIFGTWWLFRMLDTSVSRQTEMAQRIEPLKKKTIAPVQPPSKTEPALPAPGNTAPSKKSAENKSAENKNLPQVTLEEAFTSETTEITGMTAAEQSPVDNMEPSMDVQADKKDSEKEEMPFTDEMSNDVALKNEVYSKKSVHSGVAPAVAESGARQEIMTTSKSRAKDKEPVKGVSLSEMDELQEMFFVCP